MSEILTGHEYYSENREIDIDASMQSIQDAMFARNPEKYGNFLGTIKKINLALKIMGIPMSEIRVELFRCMYYAMRLVDDIVDGDTIPPLPLEKRKEIMDSILSWDIQNIKNPLYKALAIQIQDLASQIDLEEEMSQASLDILQSMNFDLTRIIDTQNGTGIRTEEALKLNFHKMDIIWTIRGTAIIFWIETESAIELLEDLWEACRVIYNLTDFISDIREWILNIAQEDIQKLWISQEDLDMVKQEWFELSQLPKSIKVWFYQEIWKYEEQMSRYYWDIQKWLEFQDWNTIKWRILHVWRNLLMRKVILPKTYIQDNDSRVRNILAGIF